MLKRTPGIGGSAQGRWRNLGRPLVLGMLPTLSPHSCTAHRGLAAPWTHYGAVRGLPWQSTWLVPAGRSGHDTVGQARVCTSERVAQGCRQRHEGWHWDGVRCTQMDRQTNRAAGKGHRKSQTHHQPMGRVQRDWSGELPGAHGSRGEDKSRRYTCGRMVPAPPLLLPAEQHCPLPCQLSWGSCLPCQVDPAAWAGSAGGVGGPVVTLPPMGAAKQQPTPTAQAAASISMFLASFCEGDRSEWALPPPTPGTAKPAGGHRLILLGPACLAHLIEASKEGEEAAEQGCAHAGDVDKGTLRGQQRD